MAAARGAGAQSLRLTADWLATLVHAYALGPGLSLVVYQATRKYWRGETTSTTSLLARLFAGLSSRLRPRLLR